jgi:hypothetical protein
MDHLYNSTRHLDMLNMKNPPSDSFPEEDPTPISERRNASRVPVIKSAKISVGLGGAQGIFNCLVLDESQSGVLVDLGTMVNLPDEVTLHMNSGATYLARRCWSAGTKAGLAFIGGQIVTGETVMRMRKMADVLQAQGVVGAVATLRAARFFDHAELRRAAEEAEAAYFRFEAILSGREQG